MKKRILTAILCLVFLMAFAGLSMAAEFNLRLGHGAAPGNPRHVVAEQFAQWVKEQTGGRVEIAIFPSETLGSDREMAEAVAMGALDMSINSQGPVGTFDPRIGVFGLPFLFNDMDEVAHILDGPIGKWLSEEMLVHGFRILAYWDNGFRHVTNNVRPIYEPKDLQGLKIRTPEDDMTLAIFETLGARPAPLAFGELYLALSQGVFDGQENPPVNIYYTKLYEVQKYLSITNHKYEMNPFLMSEITWRRLPEDIRQIIAEGAVKFAQVHREMNTKENEALLDQLAEVGMTINEANIPALREATASVYEKFKGIYGADLIEELLAELEKVR